MRKAQPHSQGLFPGFVANASSPDNNGDYCQGERMKIEVQMRYWTTRGEAGKDPGIGWSRAHLTP